MVFALIGLCFVFAVLTITLLTAGVKIGIQKKIIEDLTANNLWLHEKKKEGGIKNSELNDELLKLKKRCQIQQKIIDSQTKR